MKKNLMYNITSRNFDFFEKFKARVFVQLKGYRLKITSQAQQFFIVSTFCTTKFGKEFEKNTSTFVNAII